MCDRLFESRPLIGSAAAGLLMLPALFCTASAVAQDGMFDSNWGAGGRLQVDRLAHYSSRDQGGRLLIQSDGNLLIGGQCYDAIGGAPFCTARLHPDGSYDSSFGTNGTRIYTGLPDAAMFALIAAPGNKTLLAGETFGGEALVARTLADGSLDTSAGSGTGYLSLHFFLPATGAPFSAITATTVLANGKVLVAGGAVNDQGNLDFAIARLMPDLSGFDPTFGNGGVRMLGFDLGGGKNDAASALVVLPNGNILVAGQAENLSADSFFYLQGVVARLSSAGVLDTTFGNGGSVIFSNGQSDAYVRAMMLDRQGRIVLAGSIATGPHPSNDDVLITRMLSEGHALDVSFGTNGNVIIPFDLGGNSNEDVATALALQSDGKIVVAGKALRSFGADWFVAARVTSDGMLDTSFGSGGKFNGSFAPAPSSGGTDDAVAIAIGNGGIMVAGTGIDPTFHFVRLGLAKLNLDLIFSDGFEP